MSINVIIEPKLAQTGSKYGRYKGHFRWTEERLETLKAAYLAGNLEETTAAASVRITKQYRWPADPVRYKLYQLHHELRRAKNELHLAQAQEGQAIPSAMPHLVAGPYLWTVQIGQARQSWLLNCCYGVFPIAERQYCVYQGRLYLIQRVGTSLIQATLVSALQQEVQHAS